MRAGAVDFIIKPATPERLDVSIKSALKIEALQARSRASRRRPRATLTFGDLVMRGEAMQRVIALGKRRPRPTSPC